MSHRSPRVSRALTLSVFLILALGATVWGAASAFAAENSAEISIARTNGSPQNSGAPTQYTINFSCSAVGETSCGAEPRIRIPLVLTADPGGTPPMDGPAWKYAATTGLEGLIAEQVVENGELVIRLNPTKLNPGDSDTIQLSVTPPNGTTPNGAAWSLTPIFETATIEEVAAPTAATGEAKASSQLAVSKKTSDESTVYVRGGLVTFNITAQCSPGATTGKLFMTEGTLVDPLPAGLKFVSATPAPSNEPEVTNQVEWVYGNSKALPPGCGEGSNGSGTYQVVAEILKESAEFEENKVTFSGKPIDEPLESTSAAVKLRLLDEPPEAGELGTNFLSKSSQAPLCVSGFEKKRPDCYVGTYAGHWIQPTNPAPSTTPGSAEARFEVNVNYPASRAYETDVADPMPCLDKEVKEGEFESELIPGVVEGAGSIPHCANPAFHPTVILVNAPSLAAAIEAGWRPVAILTDGSELVLTPGSGSGASRYFVIPAGEVTKVAAIELPPSSVLTDNRLSMNVFGYGDSSLDPNDVLNDVAKATAYSTADHLPVSSSQKNARIVIEPTAIQLGISKSFGGLSNGPGGKTQLSTMSLVGSLTVPAAKTLPGPVIFADLLPEGMTWSNVQASGTFTIGGGRSVTRTVTRVPNYEQTGRELIRVTMPAGPFENEEKGGFYTIKPPSGFFRMQVPNETSSFNNSAQIFVAGILRETRPECRGGEGTGTSKFQSSDPLNLAGDGNVEENYCQEEATLKVTATGGPSFSLKKFVKGELDAERKSGLGVAETTRGGTGVYTMLWANNGSAPLKNAVIYDILPFVGDTGVDQGQSANQRGSEFATEFKAVLPLPEGVSVEYSESSNPCRDQVYLNAPGCDPVWSTTEPAALASVKSLRFTSTKTYAPAETFEVKVEVELPPGDVNNVAWNSAATDAETTAGAPLSPAEPPKVGIKAPAALVAPTISTATSASSTLPERKVSDAITIGNTEELNGTIAWKLLGPVTPNGGSCEGVTWAGAAIADQGTIPIAGAPATYDTAETTLNAHGCYGYEVTVEGPGFEAETSPVGSTGETVLVFPAGPAVQTAVSAASVLPGAPFADAITISGTEGFPGHVSWKLFGPVPPVNGACEAVEWAGAPIADEGEYATVGDGTEATPPESLTEQGCYGYETTLEGEHITTATSPIGSAGETVLVHPATPALHTRVSSDSVLPGTAVFDQVTVAGTEGFAGTLSWRLVGPVAPAVDGSCTGLEWGSAKAVASGTAAITADGTVPTASSELTEEGCYAYQASLAGEHLVPATSPFGSVDETVLVHPATPTLATSASADSDAPGAHASDQITLTGTSGFAGTIHWRLAGPVAPAADGSCNGLAWGSAGVVAQGDLAITGDGQTRTPDTTLAAAGCYGYEATVEGLHLTKATSPLGSAGETVLIKAPATVAVPPAGKAELTIVKRVAESKVEVGKPLHYTIEITNKGTAPATDTVVTDTPRSPLEFVSAKSSRGTCGNSFPLVCKLGTLAPRAKATVEVVARSLAGGKVVNGAKVTSPDDPAGKGAKGVKAATASSRSLIPLRLSKTVTPRTVEAGGTLHYAIVVGNPTAATAHALVVCDRLPAGLAYVSSGLPAKVEGGRYCWKIAALNGHATKTIRVVARTLLGAGGRLVNTATLASRDGVPRKATAAVRVTPRPTPEGGVTG